MFLLVVSFTTLFPFDFRLMNQKRGVRMHPHGRENAMNRGHEPGINAGRLKFKSQHLLQIPKNRTTDYCDGPYRRNGMQSKQTTTGN